MKIILALIFILTSYVLNADVMPDIKFSGTYKAVHPFGAFGYTAEACIEDLGEYKGEGLCFFKDGGSTIEIKKMAENEYELGITSVGTNFHLCDYQGRARQIGQTQLSSNDKNSESPGVCEVVVSFTSPNVLSIITNGKCQDYCGANMTLDDEGAVRVK